jgi:hypothetical protein
MKKFSVFKPSVKVSRIFLRDIHVYSILAHTSKLILILPTGKTRWSTMTQRNLDLYLANSSKTKNISELDLESLIDLSLGFNYSEKENSRWRKESTHSYRNLKTAYEKETQILDSNVEKRGMDIQYQ